MSVLHFRATRGNPANPVKEGDWLLPADASRSHAFGLMLPAGTDYHLTLLGEGTGQREQGVEALECEGNYGPFDISPGGPVQLFVAPTCRFADGVLAQDTCVDCDVCPLVALDYVAALPATAAPGSDIRVTGNAIERDGRALGFSWRVGLDPYAPAPLEEKDALSAAAVSASSGHAGVVTCTAAYEQLSATLDVFDTECRKAFSVPFSCRSSLCGNGVVDDGETCDPAASSEPCPPDCVYHCGDSIVEAPAEECDPPGSTCDDSCHLRH